MDFNLNEQQKMLQRMAKEFAADVIRPRAAEIDAKSQFPFDLAKELGRRGYQGLPYPAQYGGSGAGYLSYVLVLEQLCQASMTVGAIMAIDTVCEEAIFRFGTEEQKQRLLAPLVRGEKLGYRLHRSRDRLRPSGYNHDIQKERRWLCYNRPEAVRRSGASGQSVAGLRQSRGQRLERPGG